MGIAGAVIELQFISRRSYLARASLRWLVITPVLVRAIVKPVKAGMPGTPFALCRDPPARPGIEQMMVRHLQPSIAGYQGHPVLHRSWFKTKALDASP